MAERIYPKTIKGITYYYLQYAYREKIDAADTNKGKGPGSGKSRVRTHSEYLGTAQAIREKLKQARTKPVAVRHLSFGLLAAGYQLVKKLGLMDILKNRISGQRHGLPRYIFFLVAILNRMEHATSKEKMGEWAGKTILPQLLHFDPKLLNNKTFWYVADDLMSERTLREKRRRQPELADEIFVGLDDELLRQIEQELYTNVRKAFDLESASVLYDTTNFFTYIQPQTPSELAQTGHNKDSRHHLKQVGLAVGAESENGLPFFHRTYRGNSHDSPTFSQVIDELVNPMKQYVKSGYKPVLVLDKGNHSQDNFCRLKGEVDWVGSLAPSNYPELLNRPLTDYPGEWKGVKYFRVQKEVLGNPCALIMTYNPKLFSQQRHTMNRGIRKLQKEIKKKVAAYKRPAKHSVPKGIITLKSTSRHGKFFGVEIKNGKLNFRPNTPEIGQAEKRFGKHLIFSSRLEAESAWILEHYKKKGILEQDFGLLKDVELIRSRPIRHWTDTKIRAFCFSCVTALLLVRIMQLTAKNAGLEMSPAVLKQELADLKLIRWVYDSLKTQTQVSSRSTIQQKLWELFQLQEIEDQLTVHKKHRN